MPRVSVVLTSFNHARFVREAIDSALAQSFRDFELIIWDDASSDDSWDIIQSYDDPRVRAFRNAEQLRAVAGINRAISEVARGELIAIHHSDDAWEPDKLRRQVDFLDRHEAVGAVFSNAQAIDEEGAPYPDKGHFYSTVFSQPNRSRFKWLNHFFYEANALCHPSVLIRRRCYEDCGLYRYGFGQLGDLDMWIRLCLKHEIHVLPEKLVRFRVLAEERNTSGSRPETRIRWITEFLQLLRNYLEIGSYREMVAVFPDAKRYYRKEGFDPHFALAMIALGEHPFQVVKLFGIQLLFSLVQSPERGQRIKDVYGFDYRDLIAVTGKHDVFSHEYAAALARSLAEREARLAALEPVTAEQERALVSARQTVLLREADLAHMHAAVAERDRRIDALNAATAERDRLAAERDRIAAQFAAQVAERDKSLQQLHEALSERERGIVAISVVVGERDRSLARMNEVLAEREATIAVLSGEIEKRERLMGEVMQVVHTREAELEAGNRALRLRDERLGELGEEVLARDGEIASLRQTVRAREADVAHMHAAVAQRDQRAADLARHISESDERIDALQAKHAKAEAAIAEGRARLVAAEIKPVAGIVLERVIRYAKVRWWRLQLRSCPLFDMASYLERYPEVRGKWDPLLHYLAVGWREGRNPGPDFDGNYYLATYPDVAASPMPPLVHYWLHGRFMDRHPTPAAEAARRRNDLWHRQVRRCPLFDAQWYLKRYPDVAASNLDPARHYAVLGWREDRQPGPEFDPAFYRARNPDIVNHDEPLLLQYWRRGRRHGRLPNASLDFEALRRDARVPGLSAETPLVPDLSAIRSDGPFISVIIPTYNRLHLLPGIIAAWREVAASTQFPFEILVSDDGSTDGSPEYLDTVAGLPLRVLRNDHGGASRARNSAIRAARGERLLIVGDDIYPAADLLNVHAALGQRLGRLAATLGYVDWHGELRVNHLMHHITEVGNEQFSFNLFEDHAFTDFRHFYTCNVCIDRSLLLEEEVLFDERFNRYGFEDVELGYRLSLRGMKLFYCSRAKGAHYHPYGLEGFNRRQTSAGQMAVIFTRMHPPMDHALKLSALVRHGRRSRHVPVSDVVWQQRVDALTRRCNRYEELVASLPIDASYGLRQRLSGIYIRLFRAMYEYGVLQQHACPNALAVAMSGHFDPGWDAYWKAIGEEGDQAIALGSAELLQLAATLAARQGGEELHSPAQRRLFEELQWIPALEFSAPPPAQKETARVETALPALVVETTDAARAQAIATFCGLFGDKARIYLRTPAGLLARLRDDGAAEPPVPAGEVEASVFHWPTACASMLLPDHLLGAFMAIAENGVELAVVSHSLAEGASVRIGELRDHLLFSRRVAEAVLRGDLSGCRFSGKVLRLLPGPQDAADKSLAAVLGQDIEMRPDGWFENRESPGTPARYQPGYLPTAFKSRPVVLVFPIFLAVGGVERNMVEILRRLRDRFDFVIVTMERLRPEQGSLAAQALEVAARVIEMPEIAGHANYLRILNQVRAAFRPDLVWVCNGSPWFCDNASEIRRLFRDTPIVDQEVYDTEQGWINRYGEPGIRSFDYFVAINRKIEQRFLEDFRIAPERTRLIYSAIDAQRVRDFRAAGGGDARLLQRFGLLPGKHVYAFVGRLTGQKRPLDFLELARRRLGRADECFVLVGDGELAAEAVAFIERHGLTNVVRIPYVANTLELLQVSSGIVFTSAFEGLPIAMLEALAMGVPVFATDVGDIADVLADYGSGRVVPAGATADELQQGFEAWVAEREALERNARRAADLVLDRFSSENIAAQYADLWRTALGRYGKSSLPEAQLAAD